MKKILLSIMFALFLITSCNKAAYKDINEAKVEDGKPIEFTLEQLAGIYELDPGRTITITVNDRFLHLTQSWSDDAGDIIRVNGNTFQPPNKVDYVFSDSKNGYAQKLTVDNSVVLKRVNPNYEPIINNIDFKEINTLETDSIRTLKSLQKFGNLYTMRYYGDYHNILHNLENECYNKVVNPDSLKNEKKIECSMFATFGSEHLYARNFDYETCNMLIVLYQKENRLTSIGFTRLTDLGLQKIEDLTKLSLDERKSLLNAPFYTMDGINECGVTISIASLESGTIFKDNVNKRKIFYLNQIKEIIDNAKNVDMAIEIIRNQYIYYYKEQPLNLVFHHFLIADSTKSVIVEHGINNEWNTLESKNKWQVITNTPIIGIPEETLKEKCYNYKSLSEKLEKYEGKITWLQGMQFLRQASNSSTQSSTMFDINNKTLYVCISREYDQVYKLELY